MKPEIKNGFRLGFLLITGGSNLTSGKTPKFVDKLSIKEEDKGLFNLLTNEANRRKPLTLVWKFLPFKSKIWLK